MPTAAGEQTSAHPRDAAVRVGVDVGGTFTDLVAFDTAAGTLRIVKIPSTPPDFHLAVIEATHRAAAGAGGAAAADAGAAGERAIIQLIHGSTVATNALLQRAGEPVAFVTTDGFKDMLLIGRQNRPKLYALRIARPAPITPQENWFTVVERVDARGRVVTA